MVDKNNIIEFDTDDDFYELCVSPNKHIVWGEDKQPYVTCEFTDYYRDSLKANKQFRIKDPKSKIVKRGCITVGAVSRPVQNLCLEFFL